MIFARLALLAAASLAVATPTKRTTPQSVVWQAAANNKWVSSTTPRVWTGTAAANYAISMQTDGNLVSYQDINNAVTANWNSGTGGNACSTGNCEAVFQSDGNFVVYVNGAAVWNAGTTGQGATLYAHPAKQPYISIQNAAKQVIWSTGGSATKPPGSPKPPKPPKGPKPSPTPRAVPVKGLE